MKKNTRKTIPYKKRGDKLEIKLKTEDFAVYYHKEISINDLKSLSLLFIDLRNQGVDIDKAISKSIDLHFDDWW